MTVNMTSKFKVLYWSKRIGKFLSTTSLDELHQIYNVFVGHMVFVGPRPVLFNEDDLFERTNLAAMHVLKPGSTICTQVKGCDELPIPDKVEFEKAYLHSQSLIFDLQILHRTILKVVRRYEVLD